MINSTVLLILIKGFSQLSLKYFFPMNNISNMELSCPICTFLNVHGSLRCESNYNF